MSKTDKKKEKKFKSLAATMGTVFSVLVAVVLIVVGGVEAFLNFQAQQDSISEQQQLIAHDATETVRNFIEEKLSILKAAAGLGDLEIFSEERQKAVLEKLLGLEPAFRQLIFLNTEGRELVRSSRLSRTLSLEAFRYDPVSVLEVVKEGSSFISSVYIDEITNEPMIAMAVPVQGIFGNLQGVLGAEVNLKFMWDLVGGIRIGEGGFVYVIDREGTLLAFRDIGRVLRGENLSDIEEVSKFINNEDFNSDETEISRGIEGNYVTSIQAPLEFPDWAVIVEIPLWEAYRDLIYSVGTSLLAIIMGLILAVAASRRLARKITRPIERLQRAAQEMSEGNLSAEIDIESKDEVGELAGDFKEMADRLRSYTGGLEKKVAERTEELNRRLGELVEANTRLEETQKELQKEKEGVERKVKERTSELRREQARLLASINSLSVGYIFADTENRILLKNSAADDILGIPEQELSLDRIAKMFENTSDFHGTLKTCLVDQKVCELKDMESRGRIFRIVFAPIVVEMSEGPIGYVLLIEDVTEARILERTRDEFFIIASHELRTPLTAIRGNAEIIEQFFKDKIKDSEVMDMIEDIRKASVRLIAITNDFLDVSKIEQNKIDLVLKPLDINKEIQESMHSLRATAEMKNLELSFEPNTSIPPVLADKQRLNQILVNLIGNALNYTREGSVKITVSKKDGFAKVSVADTGVGIPKENQKFLFKKFQQAGRNVLTRDVTKGTGLGLYISKLTVDSMGGKVWLEYSEEGKGSVFSFTLPFAERSEEKESKA